MLSGLTLLDLNKVNFAAQNGEIEDFAVDIALKRMDIPQISHWLQLHTT